MSRETERQREEREEQAAEAARKAAQESGAYHDTGLPTTPGGKALLESKSWPKDTSEPSPGPRVYQGEPGELTETMVTEVKPPKGAEVSSRTAKGEPSTYKAGKITYYAPGTPIYELGFRTSEEYRLSQLRGSDYGVHGGADVPENTIVMTDRYGKPLSRVTMENLSKRGYQFALAKQFSQGWYRYAVKDFEGNEILLTPRQVDKIYNASDRQQFNYLVELGMLPHGTQYVEAESKGEPWGYILPQSERLRDKIPEVKIPAPQPVKLRARPGTKAERFVMGPHFEKIAVNLGATPKQAGIAAASLPIIGGVALADQSQVSKGVIGAIILGGVAIAIVTNAKNIDLYGALQAAREAVADYKAKFHTDPTYKDIVIVDGTAKHAFSLAEVIEMAKPGASIEELTKSRPDIKPAEVKKWEPSAIRPVDIKAGEQLIPPEVATETMMVTKGVGPREIANVLEQPIPGTNVRWQEPVVVLPGTSQAYPKRLIHDTTDLMERAGMMVAAQQRLVKVLPYSRQEWEDIQRILRQREAEETIRAIEAHLAKARQQGRITPEVGRHYARAYEEYLRRRAAYEAAKRAYIESLNPQPVSGKKLSDAAIEAYATYLISKAAKGEAVKPGTKIDKYVVELVTTDVQRITDAATKTASDTYTKALAQGATETQAKAAAETAAETAIKDATKTLTNTAVKQAIRTKAATKALTDTAVNTATLATTTELARTAELTLTTPLKLPFPQGVISEEEIRELVKRTPGTVAWNMGKLGKPPRDVWHISFPDGTHKVVLGKAPQGAKILADGPGSAYKTTQVIGGTFRRVIKQQHGAVTATIRPAGTPKGAKISFRPNITIPRLKSIKRGKIFYTNSGSATLMSRRPLGRRRRR